MRFNIRVYGILIHQNKVLLTEESRYGKEFTKFPGGGLEFGEGTKECLAREFMEEFELAITIDELFYINDFFQISAFNDESQVLSIYYYVSPKSNHFQSQDLKIKQEKPLWVNLDELKKDFLTFPIDKVVANQIASLYS